MVRDFIVRIITPRSVIIHAADANSLGIVAVLLSKPSFPPESKESRVSRMSVAALRLSGDLKKAQPYYLADELDILRALS